MGIDGTAGHIQTIANLASAGNISSDTTELAVSMQLFLKLLYLVDTLGNVTYEVNGQPATFASYVTSESWSDKKHKKLSKTVALTANSVVTVGLDGGVVLPRRRPDYSDCLNVPSSSKSITIAAKSFVVQSLASRSKLSETNDEWVYTPYGCNLEL